MARKAKAVKSDDALRVHIRWMIRRDMVEVLDIEDRCFEYPWCEADFIKHLRQRNCIGMVAEYDNQVIGVMVYYLEKTRIDVVTFAVHPKHWRKDIGTQMVSKLVSKLSTQRRNRITVAVRETNIDAQLFWRHCGFKAVRVEKNYWDNTTDDAYVFVYRCSELPAPAPRGSAP